MIFITLTIANYEFIYTVAGKQERMSDAGVLEWISFYAELKLKKLHLPANEENGTRILTLW